MPTPEAPGLTLGHRFTLSTTIGSFASDADMSAL
jgi:hypothetical protein